MPPVLVISGHGSVETAVRATRLGAYDFLEKPLSLERVLLTVAHALADRNLRQEVRELKRSLTFDEVLIGESEPMKRLEQQIRSAGRSGSRVLVRGENGSGKEIVARMLHRQSPRAEQPFIAVNCAAIPDELIESELFGHKKGAFTGASEDRKGKFELADGGTLFLDEIGDMSLRTQAKVLRVLQEQQFQRVGGHQTIEVDVRVIAATNKELEEEIRNGTFREDLYFRLNVLPDRSPSAARPRPRHPPARGPLPPPLCRRDEAEAEKAELRRRAEAARLPLAGKRPRATESDGAAHDPRAGRGHRRRGDRPRFPRPPRAASADESLSLREAREEFERELILRRLQEFGGNVSRTAEALGVERSNLYRKLNAYGIRVDRKA